MLAVLHFPIVFEKTENAAAHEHVRMSATVSLDRFKTLVHPVDTISAIYHFDSDEGFDTVNGFYCGSVSDG